MDLLAFFVQIYLGILFFWVIETHKYIGGSFDWKKWKAENLGIFLWTFLVCTLLGLIMFFDPNSTKFVFKFMGFALEEYGEGFNVSGVTTGLFIGYLTRKLLKKKR